MPTTLTKKVKIQLTDYSYKKDIDNRLFLASLKPFETEVLKEILCSSLKIPFSELEDHFECSKDTLLPVIEKLSTSGLLHCHKDAIFVDKEKRKALEFHVEKYEEDFEADLKYIQRLLKTLPFATLPCWYSLPKTTDNIFSSLVEKYFVKPKIFEWHLRELVFHDPVFDGIIEDLYKSKELSLSIESVKKRYKLSSEALEEVLLTLELHFALFVTFKQEKGKWKGFLTPLKEWRDLLLFKKKTIPKEIKNKKEVDISSPKEHKELEALIKRLTKKPKDEDLEKLDGTDLEQFLDLGIHEQAIIYYRHLKEKFLNEESLSIDNPAKAIREIEKSLKRAAGLEWVSFDDFVKGFIAHIGSSEPIELKKTGITWQYSLPTYEKEEIAFIESVIFSLFQKAGIVKTGIYKKKPCFALTDFGKLII